MPGFAGPLSIKCMRRGVGRWRVDGRDLAVEPGVVALVNDGEPYAFDIAPGQSIETFCPFFRSELVRDADRTRTRPVGDLLDAPSDPGHKMPRFRASLHPVPVRLDRQLGALAGALADDCDAAAEDAFIGVLDSVLDLVAARENATHDLRAARAATRTELARRVGRAVEYIHACPASRLDLAALAHVSAMSPYHFHRAFRALIGLSPARYVTSVRLRRARTLLASTDVSVSAVSLEVGFASLGSFSSAFRRAFGKPPSAFASSKKRRRP